MSFALCFNCEEVKFGALCECGYCKSQPLEDIDLNLVFSDRKYSIETLEKFGLVIKEINDITKDKDLALLCFLKHFSKSYPTVLSLDLNENQNDLIENILDKLTNKEL